MGSVIKAQQKDLGSDTPQTLESQHELEQTVREREKHTKIDIQQLSLTENT